MFPDTSTLHETQWVCNTCGTNEYTLCWWPHVEMRLAYEAHFSVPSLKPVLGRALHIQIYTYALEAEHTLIKMASWLLPIWTAFLLLVAHADLQIEGATISRATNTSCCPVDCPVSTWMPEQTKPTVLPGLNRDQQHAAKGLGLQPAPLPLWPICITCERGMASTTDAVICAGAAVIPLSSRVHKFSLPSIPLHHLYFK